MALRTASVLLSLLLINIAIAADPYDVAKFRPVLDASKLQAPTSTSSYTDLANFIPSQYLAKKSGRNIMIFKITRTGDQGRSELRQLQHWYTSSSSENKVDSRMRFSAPSVNQMTMLQIHDDPKLGSGPDKPLVRLAWFERRKKTSCKVVNGRIEEESSQEYVDDWIFADIRTSSGSTYCKHRFMKRPSVYFPASLAVQSNTLTISVDGQTLSVPVGYWSSYPSYFKAGAYLQSTGSGEVSFSSLNFYR